MPPRSARAREMELAAQFDVSGDPGLGGSQQPLPCLERLPCGHGSLGAHGRQRADEWNVVQLARLRHLVVDVRAEFGDAALAQQ